MSETNNFPPPIPTPPTPPTDSNGPVKGLVIFSLITMIALGITILTEGYRYSLVDQVFNGDGDVSLEALMQSDDYVTNSWGLAAICLVVSAILLLVWIYRTTKNLRASGYNTEKSPAWAVWSFFVPIANFWFVHGTLKDLAQGLRSTDSSLSALDTTSLRRFWYFSIAGTLATRASSGFSPAAEDFNFSDYQTEVGLSIIASALLIASFFYSRKFFTAIKK